ncbi:hypothetical protein RDWZM_000699 [Blomia tropicalis]|uniref:Uncharacterized protein n=1 Tax=Blomia tropicalis TaxID=40697 RepID=A0A9Q0MB17_BLOTA|nr:hypothetical protein RDWZM_000699 [Blomia tropicalis]
MRLLIPILLVATLDLAHGYVRCKSPAKYVGQYLGRDQECVALVQTMCHRSGHRPIGLTSTWRRAVRVKKNCKKIPKFTAIATFLGPNHHYDEPHLRQHTAIFYRCEKRGIRVYDQWRGHPIRFRLIPWKGRTAQYSGNNYYTIK